MMPYAEHSEKLSDRSWKAKEYEIYSTGKKEANEGLRAAKCHNGILF